MLFLNPWFYVVVAALAVGVKFTPASYRRWLIVAGSAGFLGISLPETLSAMVASAIGTWLVCLGVANGGSKSRLIANLGSIAVVLSVIALRVWGPLFGGLEISAATELNEVAKLLGIAYLALKLHHSIRLTLYDTAQRPDLMTMLGYTLYLPTLPAGPVLRLREWRQIETAEPARGQDFEVGFRRTVWGLGKKILIVPMLVWASEILLRQGSVIGVVGVLVLSLLVVYADFSGSSDIAIGSARSMGHRVRENFTSPFMATSLSHFWRGWHISMGDWLREHIFIPLGGMRAGRVKMLLITFVTMLFCGLWHAFEWRFVAWGVYHGLLLAIEAGLGIKPLPPNSPPSKLWLRRVLVMGVMCGSGAFFIAEWWG